MKRFGRRHWRWAISKRVEFHIYIDSQIAVGIHPARHQSFYCFAIILPFITLDFYRDRKKPKY